MELYLQEFEGDELMSEFDSRRRNILTSSLSKYLKYVQWVMEGRPDSAFEHPEGLEDENGSIQAAPKRSLEEVKAEIAIFKKYDSKVPEVLLQELETLLNDENQN